MKKQSYIKGAIIISAGGFISKLLGAVYRIPLIAYLGGGGMGIYQMVYPLYCILLTVSASGIPTGVARLIASGKSGAEKQAFFLYGTIGVIGSLLMFALSVPLSKAQGEAAVALCCKALSPSVFFVSFLSVVRGYFQGKGNMYPTAVTEVSEQVVKVGLGIFLAWYFREDTAKAVAAAVFAVTVSEAVCTLIALIWYTRAAVGIKPLFKEKQAGIGGVLKYTVPLTLTAIAMPLSQLIESIAAANLLRGAAVGAPALYGVFSGCAVTLVNLPVSVTYGLAAASVPNIAPLAEKGDISGAKKLVAKSLKLTFWVSLPFAVGLFIFAPLASSLIFRSLTEAEKELLVSLTRIMAVNAVTLSLVQTSSACLTSLGKPVLGTVTQWASSLLRVGLSAALMAFTPLSITGAAISADLCYLVAVLLNFWYIIRVNNNGSGKNEINLDRIGRKDWGFNPFGQARLGRGGKNNSENA